MTTSASSQVRRTAFSAALALGIAQSHSSRLLPQGRRRTTTIHPLGMGRVPWCATNKLLTTRDSRSPSSDSRRSRSRRSSRCRRNSRNRAAPRPLRQHPSPSLDLGLPSLALPATLCRVCHRESRGPYHHGSLHLEIRRHEIRHRRDGRMLAQAKQEPARLRKR